MKLSRAMKFIPFMGTLILWVFIAFIAGVAFFAMWDIFFELMKAREY